MRQNCFFEIMHIYQIPITFIFSGNFPHSTKPNETNLKSNIALPAGKYLTKNFSFSSILFQKARAWAHQLKTCQQTERPCWVFSCQHRNTWNGLKANVRSVRMLLLEAWLVGFRKCVEIYLEALKVELIKQDLYVCVRKVL